MKQLSFNTLSVHPPSVQNESFTSKATPIYQTSSFVFNDLDHLEGYFSGETPYLYSRYGNPNPDELGKAVAQLEGAEDGVATSSGMAAILAAILTVTQQGDHVIACADLYGGTYHLLSEELKAFGIEVTFIPFSQIEEIEQARKETTKLIYSESITNPFLRVENIEQLVEFAKKYELFTIIDNTFATPYLLNPIKQGIDLVVHSATKYLGGHSDVSAGVVVGNEQLLEKTKKKVIGLGMNLSPFEAWLTTKGLKTLALRMERQVKNAQQLADALQENSHVATVYYPKNATEKGNGAVVTIELESSCDMKEFFKHLNWIKIVPSLGGIESTVSYPLGTSHRNLPQEVQAELKINPYVVRISVGIEESHDIISQIEQAITAAK